ncbi:MAG TPA: alpha/beta hydrolase [Acidimicrobiales bacterium]|nr:alpha/beta hydrolase [Acidimicrobiales bacterium]
MERLRVGDVSLAVEVAGTGPPVLFVGGTGMPRIGWALSEPRVRVAGFRTVVFDGRGVGDSDAPEGPYSIEGMTSDAAGLIEALELAPCHVVGVSQGGLIAEELSRRRPELVRSAVLIASAGRPSAFAGLLSTSGLELSRALDSQVPPVVDVAETVALMLSSAQLQDDDLVTLWAELSAGRAWNGPGRIGQQSANVAWHEREDLEAGWGQVRRPVLVIAFEHDVLFTPRAGRQAAAAMPDAEFLEVAGAGHGGVAVKSDEVADAIVAFLRRH